MSRLVTGEAVALELRVAQLPSRVLAAGIDLLAMTVALYVGLIAAAGSAGSDAGVLAAALLVLILTFLGYPVAFETLSRGRTPGKMAMGLRVVRDDGGPISFRHALIRGVAALTVERPGVLTLGLGAAVAMFVMLLNPDGKRIGDAWAGTIVIQERVSRSRRAYLWFPPHLSAWAATLDLTALDDPLALAARQYLGRVNELSAEAREWLGRRLAVEVAARTTPPPPPSTHDVAYLAAVLTERRRRADVQLAATSPHGPPGSRSVTANLPYFSAQRG